MLSSIVSGRTSAAAGGLVWAETVKTGTNSAARRTFNFICNVG
jgi:hypothetical protein